MVAWCIFLITPTKRELKKWQKLLNNMSPFLLKMKPWMGMRLYGGGAMETTVVAGDILAKGQ